MTGSSSQDQWPNMASQIRVNTRVAGIPPASRIQPAAWAMWKASGESPASRSAT